MNKFLITIVSLFSIVFCNNVNAEVLDENDKFIIELTSDFSTLERKRHALKITLKSLDNITTEILYNVGVNVAKNYYEQTNADVVEVFIEAPKNLYVPNFLCKVTYVTDGLEQYFSKEPLRVEIVKSMPTEEQIKIARLHKKLRNNYLKANGMIDDDNLKKDIAKRLNIKYKKVEGAFGYIDIGMYYAETESVKL